MEDEKLVKQRYYRQYRNLDRMTPYERWRVILAIIQVIATLGVPFVVILLNEYLRSRG